MKKILAIVTSLAILMTPLGFNASAEENAVFLPAGGVEEFELVELSPEEAEEIDRYIESLDYGDTGISAYSLRTSDPFFEYDYTNDFFYKQLNSDEKEMYRNMYDASIRIFYSNIDYKDFGSSKLYSTFCESVIYSNTISSSRAIEIYYAFRNSNPQFFFLGAFSYTEYGAYNKLSLSVRGDFIKSAKRKELIEAIRDKTIAWLDEVNKCPNALEKEIKIIELMCSNITYDLAAKPGQSGGEYHQSIAGAIGKGTCVCAGYSQTFTYLCHLADTDCVGIMGNGHQWNRVKLFDNWYEVDVTSIDGGITINGVKYENWQFCNKSTETFLTQNVNKYTPDAKMYTAFSLPQCLKDDPVVPEYISGDVNGDGKITSL